MQSSVHGHLRLTGPSQHGSVPHLGDRPWYIPYIPGSMHGHVWDIPHLCRAAVFGSWQGLVNTYGTVRDASQSETHRTGLLRPRRRCPIPVADRPGTMDAHLEAGSTWAAWAGTEQPDAIISRPSQNNQASSRCSYQTYLYLWWQHRALSTYGTEYSNHVCTHSNGASTTRDRQRRPSYSFEPAPDESDKRLCVVFLPNRHFRIGELQMASSAARDHHLGRRPLNLHRGIAPPLEWIPSVRPDMICRNDGKKYDHLCAMSALPKPQRAYLCNLPRYMTQENPVKRREAQTPASC